MGRTLAPLTGFRLCTTPAKTMLETGSDTGDHLGPAIYLEGEELVIVCEMQAGWYRYISLWRLHADGTIRPRFGFSAVENSCVCNVHHHHVYWRFDLDIHTSDNNIVEEYNQRSWNPTSTWRLLQFETRRRRNDALRRKWRVRNSQTRAGYEIIPGATDGVADRFGVGDLWVLRYRPNEIDDGQGFTTDPELAKAHIDRFVTGDSAENEDVVIWYSAHFTHDLHENEVGHIVGPELKPFNW